MDTKSKKIVFVCFFGITILFAGCSPGPPLPPIFPGFEWLIFAAAIVAGIALWVKYSAEKPTEIDYLTEALNSINRQLNELEKKIDELEKMITST